MIPSGCGIVVNRDVEIEPGKWLRLGPEKFRPGGERNLMSQRLESARVFQDAGGAPVRYSGRGP